MRERGLAACCSALVIAVLTAFAVVSGAQEAGPPAVRFTTEEAFDASTIQPYAGRHDDVYRHIDANIQAHVKELQRWVRQPSVSAQNRGIAEMAKLLRERSPHARLQGSGARAHGRAPRRLRLLRRRRAEDARRLHDVRRAAGRDRLAGARVRRRDHGYRARQGPDGARRDQPEGTGAGVPQRARRDHRDGAASCR